MLNGSYTNVDTPCKVNSDDRLNRYYIYISSKNASHGPTLEQKMFQSWTEETLYRPRTVLVPVLVLSLLFTVLQQ